MVGASVTSKNGGMLTSKRADIKSGVYSTIAKKSEGNSSRNSHKSEANTTWYQ
jgi:hypothetical protein